MNAHVAVRHVFRRIEISAIVRNLHAAALLAPTEIGLAGRVVHGYPIDQKPVVVKPRDGWRDGDAPRAIVGPGHVHRTPAQAVIVASRLNCTFLALGALRRNVTRRSDSDLRVTFRLKAPDARKVQFQPGGDDNGLGRGPMDMTRADDGTWSITIAPAVPGFHYYWFLVDGVAMNDPASETYFGWGKQCSGVEIPDNGADFYAAKDVPHGDVRIHWYFSKTTEAWRRAYVYTPPEYDRNTRARYPCLVPGTRTGEDERGSTTEGRANFILDDLIAEGQAKPMIVVMEQGYATAPDVTQAQQRGATERGSPVSSSRWWSMT